MFEHLIFLFYLLFFLASLIGYGYLFGYLVDRNFLKLNLGYIGILGVFFCIFISSLTSFIIPHDYNHNLILHLIGLFTLLFSFKIIKKNELFVSIIIFVLLLSGIYVYKNHDDFPYYHLTYALNLSENSFIIGTGAFSHGFRTPSSLFYFHSILYMPGIKFYLFHSGPFYILYFFNISIILELIKKLKKKNFNFTYFFSLACLIFINIVFYRLSEHGTDRSSQILLALIFLIFFEIIMINNLKKNYLINLFFLLIILAASIKVLYYIYFTLIIFLFYENKIKQYDYIKNLRFIVLSILFSSIFILKSFFATGCFLYPAEISCIENFRWSVQKAEVKKLSIHYEWWSKAGGGPNYKTEMSKEKYVQNFNWFNNWLKRHFLGKVTDTMGAIALISLILFLVFRAQHHKRIKKKYLFYSLMPIIFLIEWFLNHPSMRYGGFILFAIPTFIYLAGYIDQNKLGLSKINKRTTILIIFTFLIYNIRNIDRIQSEINIYNYKVFDSPYFFVEDVKSKQIVSKNNLIVYKPINNMCWASKTPCSYNTNINISYNRNFYFIIKND